MRRSHQREKPEENGHGGWGGGSLRKIVNTGRVRLQIGRRGMSLAKEVDTCHTWGSGVANSMDSRSRPAWLDSIQL